MRIAFLGLGRMGAPMARRVVDAGHDVVVWNRTAGKAAGFPEVAEGPSAAVARAEVVVTMLADPEAVRDVTSAIARTVPRDAVLCEMSTIGPAAALELHRDLDVAVLDAPVGGGTAQAASGDLTVLVGGDAAALDRVHHVLEVFGPVVRCGGPGAGQAMKLVFNSVLGVTMTGIGEAVGLGERLGLRTETILDVLGRGGASPMVARKGPMIAARDYPASFALSLMVKDLGLAAQAAADAPAPMLARALERFREAVAAGLGESDYSAVAELSRR